MKAPFPYFGGKSRVADLVWAAFGDVDNYAEPFAGSNEALWFSPNCIDKSQGVLFPPAEAACR